MLEKLQSLLKIVDYIEKVIKALILTKIVKILQLKRGKNFHNIAKTVQISLKMIEKKHTYRKVFKSS